MSTPSRLGRGCTADVIPTPRRILGKFSGRLARAKTSRGAFGRRYASGEMACPRGGFANAAAYSGPPSSCRGTACGTSTRGPRWGAGAVRTCSRSMRPPNWTYAPGRHVRRLPRGELGPARLCRFAHEDPVGGVAVDDDHLSVDDSDLHVGPGHRTGVIVDAYRVKSAFRQRPTRVGSRPMTQSRSISKRELSSRTTHRLGRDDSAIGAAEILSLTGRRRQLWGPLEASLTAPPARSSVPAPLASTTGRRLRRARFLR